MKKNQLSGVLILLLTAFIWGSSFVAQSIGMERIGAFTYTALRSVFALAVLIPLILVRDAHKRRTLPPAQWATHALHRRKAVHYGAALGLVLFFGMYLQQLAFRYTTSGKIAFITALYMIFVPLMGRFLGKRIAPVTWVSVLVATVGLYFLSIGPGGFSSVNFGDVLTLLCAVFYAVHIVLIDKFASEAESVTLSAMQFLVVTLISSVFMFIFERPSVSDIRGAILPLLYSGVLSSGVAYTLQIVGQKRTEPTVASLIMCTESVFGVLSAMVVLKEFPTVRETAGIVLMLIAIVGAQFQGKRPSDDSANPPLPQTP